MLQCGLCFALSLLSSASAKQNDHQLDGSRGLKRGVHVRGNRVSYGHFSVEKFHRLQVSVGSSCVVSSYRDCALNCVNTPPCSSFNVASSPRSDGKYRCELLDEDKYSANPAQLVSSQEYHYYSIKVFNRKKITKTNFEIPTNIYTTYIFETYDLILIAINGLNSKKKWQVSKFNISSDTATIFLHAKLVP